jgi:hypothetical protein
VAKNGKKWQGMAIQVPHLDCAKFGMVQKLGCTSGTTSRPQ